MSSIKVKVYRKEEMSVGLEFFNGRDKSLVCKFLMEAKASGCSESTVNWYLGKLRNIRRIMHRDFEKWDKQDVKMLVAGIGESDVSRWTLCAYQVAIKKFFQIVKGYEWTSKKYPEEVDWIRTKSNNIKKEYVVLDEEDIKKMISVSKSLRDKAFIGVLFESGCRIGEMNFRINDIHWDENGCIIYVNGKTGQRPVRIIKYSAYLEMYLKHRKNPNEWVWLTERPRGRRMATRGLRRILDRAKLKARITKPCNPHNFRHSRATQLTQLGLNEIIMRRYFGWSRGSKMPSLYSHLSHRDVDQKMINMFYPKKPIVKNNLLNFKPKNLKDFL